MIRAKERWFWCILKKFEKSAYHPLRWPWRHQPLEWRKIIFLHSRDVMLVIWAEKRWFRCILKKFKNVLTTFTPGCDVIKPSSDTKMIFLYSRGGMLVIWAKKRSAGCIFKKIGKTSTSNILMLRNGRKWVGSILIFWKPIILAFQNWFDFEHVPYRLWATWCKHNPYSKSTQKNLLFGDFGRNMTFFEKQKNAFLEFVAWSRFSPALVY